MLKCIAVVAVEEVQRQTNMTQPSSALQSPGGLCIAHRIDEHPLSRPTGVARVNTSHQITTSHRSLHQGNASSAWQSKKPRYDTGFPVLSHWAHLLERFPSLLGGAHMIIKARGVVLFEFYRLSS